MTSNHNGGPPNTALTPAMKMECIKSILNRSDLTAAQKCVGAGIVANADREWVSEATTADLQRYSSAKDRETVFRATRALDEKRVVSKANVRGQSGRYNVLPPQVVTAIIDAHLDRMASGRVEADHSETKSGRAKPDGISGRHDGSEPVGLNPTSREKPVGSEPTSPVKPVGLNPTSRVETDQSEARVRARNESPSGIDIYNNKLSPLPPEDDQRVVFEKGQITLFNGLRQYWLERFEGDEMRLDLALKQAGGYVQPNSIKPLEAQVSSQLARIVGSRKDQDQRYARAVKQNAKEAQAAVPDKAKRIAEQLAQIEKEFQSKGASK